MNAPIKYTARNLLSMAERIHQDIDAYCVATMSDEHRKHMGASIIGHECDAYVWYAFRWVRKEIFSGRMLRLFERGKLEEQRVLRWLRGIGFQISDVDENGNQFRIADRSGHYGGSTDSLGLSPYRDFPIKLVCEFKTHNNGSFRNLKDKGVILSKPRHWAQMNSYGKGFGIEYGLYVGVGKNDDDLHIEVLPLDFTAADDLHRRAERLITSRVRPAKVSLNPSHMDCKVCPMIGPCFRNEPLERNCRSCHHAWPIEGGQWGCDFYNVVLPEEYIKTGCGTNWKPIA